MKMITEKYNGESFYAEKMPETSEFMDKFLALCKEYKLAPVPEDSDGEISLHDGMRLIPLDNQVLEYIENISVCLK